MQTIAQLLDEIHLNRVDCDPDVDEWVGEQLASLRSDIIKLTRDDAYQRFIRRHIAEEYTPGDNGGEPRCDCGNNCPVLEGRLPAMVKGSSQPGRAAEEWAVRHTGTPYALLTADDAYRDELAAVHNELNHLEAVTRRNTIPGGEHDGDGESARQSQEVSG